MRPLSGRPERATGGYALRHEWLARQWHARGQGFKSPQLHPRSTAMFGPTVPESPASGSRSAAIHAARPGPTAQGEGDTTALARAVSPWRPSPRTTASSGSTLGPLRMGWSYSSVGMGQCPWLSVDHRCRPMRRARRGQARRGLRSSKPTGDGRQLDRTASLSSVTACFAGKRPEDVRLCKRSEPEDLVPAERGASIRGRTLTSAKPSQTPPSR